MADDRNFKDWKTGRKRDTVFTVGEVAERINAVVEGDPNLQLLGFAPAAAAAEGYLTFADNETYLEKADQSKASAILLDGKSKSSTGKTVLRVKNARIAFAHVMQMFFPESKPEPGIHPTSVVESGAEVDPQAHIGAFCHIEKGARIGKGTVIDAFCQVGENVQIGEDCRIFPRVTFYSGVKIGNRVRIHSGTVIGSDGFGYVLDQGVHVKVPQVGTVIVHDDVEIGANVTIDRGAMDVTEIGRGTKIDNLVMIAHNVKIGGNCILVSQVGIAGSTHLGNYVVLAGQVGLAGHLKLGNQVTVGAKAGVMNNIPDGEMWLGTPAMPHKEAKRVMVSWLGLPEGLRRIRQLEHELEELKKSLSQK